MPYEMEIPLIEKIQRTPEVLSVRFKLENDEGFKAGQFAQVFLDNGNVKRYLSISNSPTEKGYLEFTKKLTGSDFSGLLEKLKAGDKALVKFPFGNFIYKEEYKKIAFISGGIGITPIRSITKYIVDSNIDCDVVLVYSCRTADDIAFKADFKEMSGKYNGLKVVHTLTDETPPEPEPYVRTGRIDAQMLKNEIPDYSERKFYVCGPPAMVDAIKKILDDELQVSKNNILEENFKGY